MSQRYFCPVEYTLRPKPKTNPKLRVTCLVCTPLVKHIAGSFSGRTRFYSVSSSTQTIYSLRSGTTGGERGGVEEGREGSACTNVNCQQTTNQRLAEKRVQYGDMNIYVWISQAAFHDIFDQRSTHPRSQGLFRGAG